MKIRPLLGYAWPYRAQLVASVAASLLDSLVTLAIPWLAGQYAAGILTSKAQGSLQLFVLLLAMLGLQAALRFLSNFLMGRTLAQVLSDLLTRVYDHLQSLPLAFHQRRAHGDVLALLTYEVTQFASFLTTTLMSVPAAVLTACGAAIAMIRLDPTLAILVSTLIPAFYFLLKVIGRSLRPLAQSIQQSNADAMAIAWENLEILPAVKAFARERHESKRYREKVEEVRDLTIRETRIQSSLDPLLQLISAVAVLSVLWIVQGGSTSAQPAEIVSFMLYAALLTRPISALAGVYGQQKMAQGTFARLEAVLSETPEHSGNRELQPLRGSVEFKNVHFTYPAREPVLRGLDLHIAPGETIAITGENGAGKSTLAHLLLRLYAPNGGQITVDGIDIQSVTLQSLRSQIGIVPQQVQLFNGTVRDNIGFGLLGASMDAIETASRRAQAHVFISQLPEGYETVIGDDGVRLSGGQRQRIALARALLKDPPILILDEATAMFDPDSEESLLRDCAEVLGKRTVILITHRPASLRLASRIVELRHGVVEGIVH